MRRIFSTSNGSTSTIQRSGVQRCDAYYSVKFRIQHLTDLIFCIINASMQKKRHTRIIPCALSANSLAVDAFFARSPFVSRDPLSLFIKTIVYKLNIYNVVIIFWCDQTEENVYKNIYIHCTMTTHKRFFVVDVLFGQHTNTISFRMAKLFLNVIKCWQSRIFCCCPLNSVLNNWNDSFCSIFFVQEKILVQKEFSIGSCASAWRTKREKKKWKWRTKSSKW